MEEQFQPDASAITVDVTDTTEEVIENSAPPIEYINRNMFYANDALRPPPPSASKEDKRRYQQIKKSIKRLRKLEKNPIFMVQMLDLKAQQKILDEMNDEG